MVHKPLKRRLQQSILPTVCSSRQSRKLVQQFLLLLTSIHASRQPQPRLGVALQLLESGIFPARSFALRFVRLLKPVATASDAIAALDAVCTMTCDAQINEVKAHAAQRRVSHNALTRHLICFFIARFATCVRQPVTMRSGAECIGCSQSASIQLYSDIYRRKHKLLLSSPRHSRVSSTQDCSFRKFVSP